MARIGPYTSQQTVLKPQNLFVLLALLVRDSQATATYAELAHLITSVERHPRQPVLAKCISVLVLAAASYVVHAHAGGRSGRALDWHNEQIDQVMTWDRGQGARSGGRNVLVETRNCLEGGQLLFKVNDAYAFDIDETVWLDMEFHSDPMVARPHVVYNSAYSSGATQKVQVKYDPGHKWSKVSVPLEHARFANLGSEGSDFSITAQAGDARFTLCSVSIRRSYATPVNKTLGWVDLEVIDEQGWPTPARVGLYSESGRLPLPSDEALLLKSSRTGASRVLALGRGLPKWPVQNREVFYTDGRYHSRLPVGNYELIVAKGLEYRLARQKFSVVEGKGNTVRIQLNRWVDMATDGWYSGDDHFHYERASIHDDHILQQYARAEDVNVINVLQYGNSANLYLTPYEWKAVVPDAKAPYAIVPGQEDPRTSLLGHTTTLNIQSSIRAPSRYLLYDVVFEKARAQGGLAGYAHAVGGGDHGSLLDPRGMAIDVPLGLVDFAEIMMPGLTGEANWFDFLNLGYRIPPTAGTDNWTVPGAVRNYVQLDLPFSPQAWFDALKQGRTFVTSGPRLQISVNGQGMGSELRVKRGERLVVEARASINPDIDELASLELIEQGETVKKVAAESGANMHLRHELSAKHGTWFVLRARGRSADVLALSGPIYIWVDGMGFWKPSQVPAIVTKLRRKMQQVVNPSEEEPNWEGENPELFFKYWEAQQAALRQRIDQANAVYDDLVRRAAESSFP